MQAVRSGRWKLFLPLDAFTQHPHFRRGEPARPLLFDLWHDVGCRRNVAKEHPDIVARLTRLADRAREELGDRGRAGRGQRPPGRVEHPRPVTTSGAAEAAPAGPHRRETGSRSPSPRWKPPQTVDVFRKPKNGNTYVVAHRGAHEGIPENTLAAYRRAIELGCDFVEIDVRRTRDGKFVSIHNATVDAYVEGISGRVSEFTVAELKRMDIGRRVGPEWVEERIPTLEEILQLCRGKIGIYLDLKEPHVKELVSIIRRYGMERDVLWYIPASHMATIREVKQYDSRTFPMPDPGPKENIAKVVQAVHPRVLATDMRQLDEEYMTIAKANNVKVIVDEDKGDEEEWEKILQWGTDGIQTDHPGKLIEFLKTRRVE